MGSLPRRAFTLIELLVVVAVIAVLAAILFPVMARARERAALNKCLSNMRQISIAAMTYTADSDETYPLARFAPNTRQGMANWTWKRAILPYLDDTDVFRCPLVQNPWPPCPDTPGALGDPSNIRPEYREGRLRMEWLPASYAYSGGFFSARAQSGEPRPRRTTELSNPAGVLYIVPSRLGGAELGPDALVLRGVNPDTGLPDARYQHRFGPMPAHLGRLPFIMADGHLQTLKLMDTVLPVDRWQSADPEWDSGADAGRRRLVAAAKRMQTEVNEYH